MTTWLKPTSSGIAAFHALVPEAVPARPVLVDQVTLATPDRSDAVPRNVSEASVVENDVVDGYVMLSVGPVVSVPVGGGATVRVTLTVRTTVSVAAVAVTVKLLNPAARGMFKADQFVPLTAAVPDAPVLESHVTTGVPLPPVTVPESDTVADVVVAGGTFTISVRGDGAMVWRVRLTVWETLPDASAAVTVMLLDPRASGTLVASQFVPSSEATPDPPVLDDHVTVAPPLPPVTVPDSEIEAAVVTGGGAFTVRVSGRPVPVCAA